MTTYQQIFTEDIPQSDTIEFEALLPKFKRLQMTEWIIFFVILFIGGILTHNLIEEIPNWIFYVFYVLWGVAVCYVTALTHYGFPNKGFAICEKDVHYRTGWLSRKITSVPICRIQHLEVSQSSLGKIWNIAKINIYTAGDNDLTIKGISFEKAEQIKNFISDKIKQNE